MASVRREALCVFMHRHCPRLPLFPSNDATENLSGFRHDEPQAIKVIQDLDQLTPLECGNAIRQLAALPERIDEILSRLPSPLRHYREFRLVHTCLPG